MNRYVRSEAAAAQTEGRYRGDIDGLRAFAVLAVIAFHAFPGWLPGGFVGVDIFFVISGYLISGHIVDALESGKFTLAGFYSKRIRRIFPALITVLVACLAFGWVALLVDEYEQLSLHVLGGAGFVSNFILWNESGYFDNTAVTKPLLHLWSLGIEEQFYIVWPLVAWLLWRLRLVSTAPIILIAGASFALNATFFQTDPTQDFYSPLTRFWELLAGAALAQRERSHPTLPGALSRVAAPLGLGLLLVSVVVMQEGKNFPGWWALLPVVGTVLFIAAGPLGVANRLVGIKPLVAMGLISYPLYLWHWPLLSFARIVEGEMPSRSLRMTMVLAAFALAVATYFVIERPLRFGRRRRAITFGLVSSMALVGSFGLWAWSADGISSRPTIADITVANGQFGRALWQYTANETCLDRYPFEEAKSYSYWFCMSNNDAPPSVFLYGDSYANHLYPGFAKHPELGNETIFNIGTCGPLNASRPEPGSVALSNWPCEPEHMYDQQKYIENIISGGSINLAIISGFTAEAVAHNVATLSYWIDLLEAEGARVVIFHPHVRPPGDVKGCFARPFKAPTISCDIPAGVIAEKLAHFQPLMDSLQALHPRVLFFDQNVVFCEQDPCSYISEGKPMFRDEFGHFSEHASMKVGEAFFDWAQKTKPSLLSFSR